MRPEDLREFAQRPRGPVADLKRQFWEQARAVDPLAALRAAHAAFEHARALANFPPASYTSADFEHHLALKKLIDRAATAFSLR